MMVMTTEKVAFLTQFLEDERRLQEEGERLRIQRIENEREHQHDVLPCAPEEQLRAKEKKKEYFFLYLIWSFQYSYCKIGIASGEKIPFVRRYRTYLANFVYWCYPIAPNPCTSQIARQYETLLKVSLKDYIYEPADPTSYFPQFFQENLLWSGLRGLQQEFYIL